MNALLDSFVHGGESLWRASWQAAVLAGLVLLVQLAFGRHIAPRWRHAMWMLVFVRLALPVLPSSPVSVFNLAPAREVVVSDVPAAHEVIHATAAAMSTADFSAEMRARAVNFVAAQPEPPPAAPMAVAVPAAWWEGWPRFVAGVWAIGVALLLTRVAWATWRISRTMRRLDRVEDVSTLAVLRDTAAELRVRRLPTMLTGDELFSPALVGFIRPRLLLPRDLLQRFDSAELRLVLAHELAHLKRCDVLVNWIATLLTIVHWPNPVAWLAAWRLRVERELATDELVLSRTTNEADRKAYGHTMVKLLEALSGRAVAARPVPAGGVGILEGKQQMKRRILMIARFANRSRTWTVVAASLVLGLCIVALTDAAEKPAPVTQGAEPAKPSTAEAAKGDSPTAAAVPDGPKDYILGPNDLVSIIVFELEGPGKQTIKNSRISGSGNITLPYLSAPVRITGMTELAARDAIAKAYEQGGVLSKAKDQVSVDVVEMRNAPKAKPEIGADELVIVSIMDLVGPGVESVRTVRLDDAGNIRLPYVGEVKAVGLKPIELEKAITKAYEEKKVAKGVLVAVSLPERGESHRLANAAEGGELPGQFRPMGAAPAGGMPGFGGGARPAGEVPGSFGAPAAAPADPAVTAALGKRLPELTFDGIPLTDVIDFFREATSVNVAVDWRALEAAGIERNVPVSENLKDITFNDALTIILRGVDHHIGFKAENGAVQIGLKVGVARADTDGPLVVRSHNAGDLLQMAGDRKAAGAELTNVIVQTIEPEFWRDAGGTGSVRVFGDKLIVTASEPVHRQVEELLGVLREGPSSTSSAATTKPAQ